MKVILPLSLKAEKVVLVLYIVIKEIFIYPTSHPFTRVEEGEKEKAEEGEEEIERENQKKKKIPW